MGILDGMGQPGSNPFARRALQYDQLLVERGPCSEVWKSLEEGHDFHTCSRYKRHGANHKCACGASRRIAKKGVGRR